MMVKADRGVAWGLRVRKERAHGEPHQDADERQGEHAEIFRDAVLRGVDHATHARGDSRIPVVRPPIRGDGGRHARHDRNTTQRRAATASRHDTRRLLQALQTQARACLQTRRDHFCASSGTPPRTEANRGRPDPGERADRRHLRGKSDEAEVCACARDRSRYAR
eukprot:CAMPEP_0197116210 /NCGR_PEP_ID=MMETSP1390-20130617/12_1 /TAXON_ID=38833 /ORGANISM="Micromonas sp., Strain CCMP2099" /LENGTH=164 /DNA_ID=CAMNT_0042557403 /DNA_START=266 /DNA_END=756 /DNA_ORIENTATION=+